MAKVPSADYNAFPAGTHSGGALGSIDQSASVKPAVAGKPSYFTLLRLGDGLDAALEVARSATARLANIGDGLAGVEMDGETVAAVEPDLDGLVPRLHQEVQRLHRELEGIHRRISRIENAVTG